jgi:hypothetical protein
MLSILNALRVEPTGRAKRSQAHRQTDGKQYEYRARRISAFPLWMTTVRLADDPFARGVSSSLQRDDTDNQYQHVVEALNDLPKDTAVDGEIVALDDTVRPNLNSQQHSQSQASRI